jgi:hypothetical protein
VSGYNNGDDASESGAQCAPNSSHYRPPASWRRSPARPARRPGQLWGSPRRTWWPPPACRGRTLKAARKRTRPLHGRTAARVQQLREPRLRQRQSHRLRVPRRASSWCSSRWTGASLPHAEGSGLGACSSGPRRAGDTGGRSGSDNSRGNRSAPRLWRVATEWRPARRPPAAQYKEPGFLGRDARGVGYRVWMGAGGGRDRRYRWPTPAAPRLRGLARPCEGLAPRHLPVSVSKPAASTIERARTHRRALAARPERANRNHARGSPPPTGLKIFNSRTLRGQARMRGR